jgi:hypothetical protein
MTSSPIRVTQRARDGKKALAHREPRLIREVLLANSDANGVDSSGVRDHKKPGQSRDKPSTCRICLAAAHALPLQPGNFNLGFPRQIGGDTLQEKLDTLSLIRIGIPKKLAEVVESYCRETTEPDCNQL